MTLNDLLAALQSDLGYEAIPSAVVTTRLTRYVNEGLRHILSLPELAPLRMNTVQFTSVPGQGTCAFPPTFVQIAQVVNRTQNVRLRLMTADQFRTLDPQEVSSGTPTHYVPMGLSPVHLDPPLTRLFAVSTDLADTTQIVKVRGILNSLFHDLQGTQAPAQTATLTGTTPVEVGRYPSYIAVQQFEVSAPTVGFVALIGAAQRPDPPSAVNNGSGGYPAVARFYKMQYKTLAGSTVTRESLLSASVAFTPSGTGAEAVVLRAGVIGEFETHWQVHASADNVTYYALSANIPLATAGYADTAAPATYAAGVPSPLVGGTRLGAIPVGQLTTQYQRIRLWPTPSAEDIYVADGPTLITDLSATYDIPVLPEDFHLLLADYARMREYEYRDDSRVGHASARYEQKLKQLRDRIMNPPDWKPRVGRLIDRSNNLDHDGVSFPSGRW